MTYYAYTEIRHDDGVVKFGDEVSQKDIGVEDDIWEGYIADQVVGEEPVPEDLGTTQTINQYYVAEAAANLEAAQAGEIPAKATPKSKLDESAPSKS